MVESKNNSGTVNPFEETGNLAGGLYNRNPHPFTYTPPSGTTQVIYEYHAMHGSDPDIWPIPHFRLYLY